MDAPSHYLTNEVTRLGETLASLSPTLVLLYCLGFGLLLLVGWLGNRRSRETLA